VHASDWAEYSTIAVGVGVLLMGLWRVFGVMHRLVSASEQNTRELQDNTHELELVGQKVEGHTERLVRLEAVVAVVAGDPDASKPLGRPRRNP
jgi:cell shape-determining protein MreC